MKEGIFTEVQISSGLSGRSSLQLCQYAGAYSLFLFVSSNGILAHDRTHLVSSAGPAATEREWSAAAATLRACSCAGGAHDDALPHDALLGRLPPLCCAAATAADAPGTAPAAAAAAAGAAAHECAEPVPRCARATLSRLLPCSRLRLWQTHLCRVLTGVLCCMGCQYKDLIIK